MNEKTTASPPINERREYFRVQDNLQLRYLPVSQEDALSGLTPPPFEQDIGYSLIREIQQLDNEQTGLLRSIADHSREIEQYLRHINRKLDMIAAQIAELTPSEQTATIQTVTLSEGGLDFTASEDLQQGRYLALQITLPPSHTSLVLFGRILSSEAQTGGQFAVAVSFVAMDDADRQILARHIMQVQLNERRQRRGDY